MLPPYWQFLADVVDKRLRPRHVPLQPLASCTSSSSKQDKGDKGDKLVLSDDFYVQVCWLVAHCIEHVCTACASASSLTCRPRVLLP
jgi:hypothetical protein